jgi:hypothetical protein
MNVCVSSLYWLTDATFTTRYHMSKFRQSQTLENARINICLCLDALLLTLVRLLQQISSSWFISQL